MRTRRIRRILKLLQALETGKPQHADALAEAVGASRRTVFRDLELLAEAGVRYTYDRNTHRYSTDRATLLPPVSLSHGEALALLVSIKAFRRRGMAPDDQAAVLAALKLESLLPEPIRKECGAVVERIEIRPEPASDAASVREIVAVFQGAIADRRKVHVAYDSYYDNTVIDVTLCPYRVAYIHRGWYVIAQTDQTRDVRTYKLERVLRLRVLPDTYDIDPSFDLDDYFGNAWLMIRGDKRFHVKIRFLPKVAANVDEVFWHKTQRTEYEDDGSLIFEADVDGIEEISWWVLGYGDQAQVLEPVELRELVGERVRGMWKYYHNGEQADRARDVARA